MAKTIDRLLYTLREEILADLADSLKIRQINFLPKLTFFLIYQIKFPPKLSFFAIRQIKFPSKLLFFAIRQTFFGISLIIFFHISYSRQKSQKHEKTKNENLILSLKLVNFNNTFALLLYFFLCQDTSGKMFLSIRQNKFTPKFNFCVDPPN